METVWQAPVHSEGRWLGVFVLLCLTVTPTLSGCPEGYVNHQPSRLCYKAFNNRTTYNGAVSRCSSEGGTLAMPRDNATNNFLIDLKNAVDKNALFRFGLTDYRQEGVWVWDDNVPLGDFSAWGLGEPNNENNEDCAEYFPDSSSKNNSWNDGPCAHDDRKFICQFSAKSDYCIEESVDTEAGRVTFPDTDGGSFSYSAERCNSSAENDKPLASRFCRTTQSRAAVWDQPVLLTCDFDLQNLSQVRIYTKLSQERLYTKLSQVRIYTKLSRVFVYTKLSQVRVYTKLSQVRVYTKLSQVRVYTKLSQVRVYTKLSQVRVYTKLSQVRVYTKLSQVRVYTSLSQVRVYTKLSQVRVYTKLSQVRVYTRLSQIVVNNETALSVATELQVITTQAETLSSGDVNTIITIVQEIVNASATEQIGDSLLTTVDNLIKVNVTVLQQSQEERRGPTRAVQALETFADTVILTTDTYTAVRPGVALQATDISPEELNKGQEVRLSYTLYNSSSLFVQTSQRAARPSQGSVGTRIIGGRIAGRPVKNLPEPVIITFTPLQSFLTEDVKEVTCVFWDFEAEAGQGAWSTEGCENIPSETKGRYTCACNHLTNFALLFDVSGKRFGVHETPLEVITIVGCAVSIACLGLTLLSFIVTRRDKRRTRTGRAKNQRLVLINLCVALLAILVIFLVGINRTASPIGCMVVATLLHYFLLASLMWMAVEAVNLYRAVVQVFDSVSGHFIIKAGAVAWAGLILLFNLLVFILVMRKLVLKEKRQHELRGADAIKVDRRWIIHQIRRACSIMALFGLTWVFGFFVIDDARTVFAYLFCIFNTLQGLFIFIFHCVMREDMKEWRKKLTCWKKLACIGRKKQDVFQVDQNMSLSASAQSPQNIGLSPLSFDRKPKHEAVMTISMGSLDH
ncbi:hypothetical protein Bbelb_283740 [Branchiostoma belcheri]|nr:hypothetical protein Bbelb_283740 [Branchiostoma belcheri]